MTGISRFSGTGERIRALPKKYQIKYFINALKVFYKNHYLIKKILNYQYLILK